MFDFILAINILILNSFLLSSSGYDQCGGRTIYTNVAEFESWISEVLANN
jgi:hypothetical protein